MKFSSGSEVPCSLEGVCIWDCVLFGQQSCWSESHKLGNRMEEPSQSKLKVHRVWEQNVSHELNCEETEVLQTCKKTRQCEHHHTCSWVIRGIDRLCKFFIFIFNGIFVVVDFLRALFCHSRKQNIPQEAGIAVGWNNSLRLHAAASLLKGFLTLGWIWLALYHTLHLGLCPYPAFLSTALCPSSLHLPIFSVYYGFLHLTFNVDLLVVFTKYRRGPGEVFVPGSRQQRLRDAGYCSPATSLSPVSGLACIDAVFCLVSCHTGWGTPQQLQITLFCAKVLPAAPSLLQAVWWGAVGPGDTSGGRGGLQSFSFWCVTTQGVSLWHDVCQVLCPWTPGRCHALGAGMLSRTMGCLSSWASKLCPRVPEGESIISSCPSYPRVL